MSTNLAMPTESMIPIRMLNINDCEVKIRRNTVLGTVTNIEAVVKSVEDTTYEKMPFINFEKSCLQLNEKEKLYKLLKKYKCVFARSEYDLGRTNVLKHTIPLETNKAIKQHPYRMEYAKREESQRQIQGMLENHLIRPSHSPWTSPVVMVKKKDGTFRLCVDYRQLNAATVKDTYPLPRIDEMLDKLHKAKFFTTMDLQSGFWQIEIEEEDRYKTAFSTGEGLYEFNVLPFGLTGSPPTFQRCMNIILMDASHAMVYIDDILIYSTTFEEHLKDIETVLIRLKNAGLKLKPSKCEWAKETISFLGHTVSSQGIQPDPRNIEKVAKAEPPKNVKGVQRFLGLASYYRRFIKNFAKIVNPITQLLQKDKKFMWTKECNDAFEKIKFELTNPPILIFPDFDKPFLIMTDASGYAIGAVLSQYDNKNKDHPIAYASRTLTDYEKRYAAIEREALALVFATKYFRHYIWSKEIILLTDHKPLQWLMSHKDTSSRLIRWALALQDLNIQIKYRTGKSNGNADYLSRIEEPIVATVMVAIPMDEKLKEEQDKDSELIIIRKFLDKGTIPEDTLKSLSIHLNKNGYKYNTKKNILYYRTGENNLLVIPNIYRSTLLLQYHDGHLGGHLSARKVTSKMIQKYFWPDMLQDIKTWCKNCKICSSRKNTIKSQIAHLKPIKPPKSPMEITAMDVIGPLPLTMFGNKFILVFSDYLTKWPEAFAIQDQKAETIAKIFVEKIIFNYGAPKKLITDQGTNFMSELLKSICKIFDIMKLNTSPYHPQTDGLVERFNGTLLNMLASYTSSNQNDWDVHIPSCLFAYRTAVHPSTKETPFFLMYGRDTFLPIDHLFTSQTTYQQDDPSYLDSINQQMSQAWNVARQNILFNQESYKEYYDRKAKQHSYKIGDRVLLLTVENKKGKTHKLYRPYQGPYRIIEINEPNLKLISIFKPNSDPIVVHMNRCRPAPLENIQFSYEKQTNVEEPTIEKPYNFRPRKTNTENNNESKTMIKRIKLKEEFDYKKQNNLCNITDLKLNELESCPYIIKIRNKELLKIKIISESEKHNFSYKLTTIPNKILTILLIISLQFKEVQTNTTKNLDDIIRDINPLEPYSLKTELIEHWRKCCSYCIKFKSCHKNCKDYSYTQFMFLSHLTQLIPQSLACLKLCHENSKIIQNTTESISMTIKPFSSNSPIQNITTVFKLNEEKIISYIDIFVKITILIIASIIALIIIPIIYYKKKQNILRTLRTRYTRPPSYRPTYYSSTNNIIQYDDDYLKYVNYSQLSINKNSHITDLNEKLQLNTFKNVYRSPIEALNNFRGELRSEIDETEEIDDICEHDDDDIQTMIPNTRNSTNFDIIDEIV